MSAVFLSIRRSSSPPDVTQISVRRARRRRRARRSSTRRRTWAWLDGPDGEEALFEHQLDVDGGDVAYSHGIATRPTRRWSLSRHRCRSVRRLTKALFAVRPHADRRFPNGPQASLTAPRHRKSRPRLRGVRAAGSPHSTTTPRSAVCHPWVSFSSLLAMTGANGCGDAVGDDDNLLEVTAWVGGNSPFGSRARRVVTSSNRSRPTPAISAVRTSRPSRSRTPSPSSPARTRASCQRARTGARARHARADGVPGQPTAAGAEVNVGDTIVVEDHGRRQGVCRLGDLRHRVGDARHRRSRGRRVGVHRSRACATSLA